MTNLAKDMEIKNDQKKLPKYREIYYRVMIGFLNFILYGGTGSGIVFSIVGCFYFVAYFLILIFFGLDPDQKQWQNFVVGFVCGVLFVYHGFFYFPVKIDRLVNEYRKKLGESLKIVRSSLTNWPIDKHITSGIEANDL